MSVRRLHLVRRAWINFDLVWAAALVLTGVAVVIGESVIPRRRCHRPHPFDRRMNQVINRRPFPKSSPWISPRRVRQTLTEVWE